MNNNEFNNEYLVKGMALLILAVGCNFTSELFGCKLQYLLTNNMFFKHFILIFIIFFSINFTNSKLVKPELVLKYTLLIYVLFLLFSKMNIYLTLFVLFNLMIQYYLYTYIDYYRNRPQETKINLKHMEYHLNIMNYVNVGVIMIGFVLYILKQKKSYNKDFDIVKFIFGIPVCRQMK